MAQELHITQPGLSHAISQLENELGVALFEKNGRNTTLTRFGDEFLACTKQTISTLDGGVDSIQREARGDGVIRVGFPRAFGTQFVPQLEQKKYDLVFFSKPPAEYRFTSVAVEFVLDKYKKHEN